MAPNQNLNSDMKNRFLPVLAVLLPACLAHPSHAQPDPNTAPKGDNPANRQPGGGRLRDKQGQQLDLRRYTNLTPEQQRTAMEMYLRRELVTANVTEIKQQDAAITFVTGELEAQQKLGETARALALATRNPATTDAQVAGLLNEYVAAIQEDKTRHQKALDTLKTVVTVSQFPRLEASLTLLGLWNDAPSMGGNLFGGRGNGNGRGQGQGQNQNRPQKNQNGAGDNNRAPF